MGSQFDPSSYLQIINEAMARNEITDASEVICALLCMLKEQHTAAIWSEAGKVFNDGLDGVTGKHAISPADSLWNLAVTMSWMHEQNAENLSKHKPDVDISLFRFLSSRLRCFADLLSDVIPGWEAEGKQLKAQIERVPPHVSPREGDSLYQPWEGLPVDFEGRPMDQGWGGRTLWSAKDIVLAHYPNAESKSASPTFQQGQSVPYQAGGWVIYDQSGLGAAGIGQGKSEDEAWADAARRLNAPSAGNP